MIKEKRKNRRKHIFAGIFLYSANLILFLTIWLANSYDKINIDQILYQLKSSAAGVNRGLTWNAVLIVGGATILLGTLELGIYFLLSGRFREKLSDKKKYLQYCDGKTCSYFRRHALGLSVMLVCLSGFGFLLRMNVFPYLYTLTTKSNFIENHYVDPEQAELTFPENKRNLVYIFLESMESTYADQSAGEVIADNYIPELWQLAEENINFSNTQRIGGALSFTGTTWTAAAMVAQTSGVTIKVPLTAENYGGENSYMPGIVSLGEILEKEGYEQTLLMGSDAAFASRDSYFTEHGNYDIVDINALKKAGRLPKDYRQWWGFEDEKLFVYAKEELTRLAQSGKPFNFTMLTADTHFPDGYRCRLCQDKYEKQYANVLACSSRQVYAFVQWIQQQPFYENTTIVISGDHLTMDPDFLHDIDEDYTRTVYNCIINPAVEPVKEKNRRFGTYDMFPTTLAAMGVEISGERLGLGTNLFSGVQTLTEQYGFQYLDVELQKHSKFYDKNLFANEPTEP